MKRWSCLRYLYLVIVKVFALKIKVGNVTAGSGVFRVAVHGFIRRGIQALTAKKLGIEAGVRGWS
jgi:hypothetical protein